MLLSQFAFPCAAQRRGRRSRRRHPDRQPSKTWSPAAGQAASRDDRRGWRCTLNSRRPEAQAVRPIRVIPSWPVPGSVGVRDRHQPLRLSPGSRCQNGQPEWSVQNQRIRHRHVRRAGGRRRMASTTIDHWAYVPRVRREALASPPTPPRHGCDAGRVRPGRLPRRGVRPKTSAGTCPCRCRHGGHDAGGLLQGLPASTAAKASA